MGGVENLHFVEIPFSATLHRLWYTPRLENKYSRHGYYINIGRQSKTFHRATFTSCALSQIFSLNNAPVVQQ